MHVDSLDAFKILSSLFLFEIPHCQISYEMLDVDWACVGMIMGFKMLTVEL